MKECFHFVVFVKVTKHGRDCATQHNRSIQREVGIYHSSISSLSITTIYIYHNTIDRHFSIPLSQNPRSNGIITGSDKHVYEYGPISGEYTDQYFGELILRKYI